MAQVRGKRKSRIGKVVSDKTDKTIAVAVERSMAHPLYGRVIRRGRKLMAHDADNEARVGDTVEICETRPLSKTKRWRLLRIVGRAK